MRKPEKTGTKVGHLNKQVILRDKRTGKLYDFGDAEIRTEDKNRNKSFLMMWPQTMKSSVFEIQFLIFLLNAMRSNYVHIKNETLATKFGCSRQRIERLKQKLEKDGLLKYQPGVIFVNPNLFYRGNAAGRDNLIAEYWLFKPEA